MSVLQVPLALLGEKLGELSVVAAGSLGLAAGFLLLSSAFKIPTVLLSLIFAKGTAAGQHSLSSSLLSRTFEESGRRAAMGTYNFSGDVGKVCFPFILALMINLWGWRQATFTLALIGMLLGLALWGVSRKLLPQPPVSVRRVKESGWGVVNRLSFSSLLIIGIIDISVRNGLLTFLPFLLLEKGVSPAQVGFALTLVFAGGAAGKFFCGLLAEWFGVIAMVVGTEVLTATGILSIYYFSPATVWVLLPFVGVALNGTSSVLYASVAEVIAPHRRSRGYGLYYALTLGSGAVSPVLCGLIGESLSVSYSIIFIGILALLTLPFTWALRTSRINPM